MSATSTTVLGLDSGMAVIEVEIVEGKDSYGDEYDTVVLYLGE